MKMCNIIYVHLYIFIIACYFLTAAIEDADFDADDLGPEVLSMLDEVECKSVHN